MTYGQMLNGARPNVIKKWMEIRLAINLRETFGSTDEELCAEEELEELCNRIQMEGFYYKEEIMNGCFVVTNPFHDTIPYTLEELVELMVTGETGTIGTDIIAKEECN